MIKKAILSITGDKQLIKIVSTDGGTTYFEGDEEQAWRVASYVGGIIGECDYFAYFEGEISLSGKETYFTAPDAAGLGTLIEIEVEDEIKKLSCTWL